MEFKFVKSSLMTPAMYLVYTFELLPTPSRICFMTKIKDCHKLWAIR